MKDGLTVIKERTSANNFDPNASLSEAEIRELVAYASESPSSFNIQHWRFIAVQDQASKLKLKNLAFGQNKVADAAVTFIVLGDLRGIEKLPAAIRPMLDGGAINQAAYDGWIGMANGMYRDNPQLSRDEAIRSTGLAGMTLMLAAEAKGLASCPMIGFDAEGVRKEFAIPDRYVISMLIAVGPAAPGNWPRKSRLNVNEILAFDKGREF